MSNNCREKRIIESLRVGLIGEEGVTELTVGREKETKIINQWIKEDDGSIIVIGPYGMGKTHTNMYIQKTALNEGYGVAYVQVGNESPLHKPAKIFQTIFQNLKFQKNEVVLNIHEFIEEHIKESLKRELTENHFTKNHFLRPVYNEAFCFFKEFNSIQSQHYRKIWQYLLGKNPIRPLGINYRIPNENFKTNANIYFNILGSISLAAKEIGFKGIILLFDELEKNDTESKSSWKEKGEEFMEALGRVSKNDEILMNEYVGRYTEGFFGEETQLQYSGTHLNKNKTKTVREKNTNYEVYDAGVRYFPNYLDEKQISVGIKCAFSFVQGQGDNFLKKAQKMDFNEIVLSKLEKNHEEMLVKKIIQVYKTGFSEDHVFIEKFSNNESELIKIVMNKYNKNKKEDEAVRKLIRLTVSIMDFFRLHQQDDLELILEELNLKFK